MATTRALRRPAPRRARGALRQRDVAALLVFTHDAAADDGGVAYALGAGVRGCA
jgi:hypothetical protein